MGRSSKIHQKPVYFLGSYMYPKEIGGIGLKNLALWNKANIIKLVWHVAMKKDVLWVKWVHEKYLKSAEGGAYKAPNDCTWYWRKVVNTK